MVLNFFCSASSCREFGWFCRFEIRCCKMSQACSIGFRSGDFAGQSMPSIVSRWIKNCCVTEHDRFGGGSVMVWGDISYDGSTDLYGIRNGSFTCIRYRDEILVSPQTITEPPPNRSCSVTQQFLSRSFVCLQTRLRPS
jgi:hypothetical protein